MKKKTANPISKAKTAEEILNQLGLPNTPDHLKIAQAAIDDGAQIRSQIRTRAESVMAHLQRFTGSIKKLGVEDIGQMVKEFIRDKREIKRLNTQLSEAERALIETSRQLSGEERANLPETHQLALRRAKAHHPMLAKYGL